MKQFFFFIMCCAFSFGAYAVNPNGSDYTESGPWEVGYPNPTDVIAQFDGDHTLTFTGTGAIKNFIINYASPFGVATPWYMKIYVDQAMLDEIWETNGIGEDDQNIWGYYDHITALYNATNVTWTDENDEPYLNAQGQEQQIWGFITGWEKNTIADKITKVVIGSGITHLGDGLAWQLNITELEWPTPNTVETVGRRAFSAHKIVTEQRTPVSPRTATQGTDWIVIPEGVKTIRNYGFESGFGTAKRLIELPSTLETLEHDALGGSGYKGFDSYAVTPPNANSAAFTSWAPGNPAFVVAGTKSAYQAASTWSTFTNYVETLTARPTSIDTPKATDRAVKAIAGGVEFSKIGNAVVYNIAGQKLFEGTVIPGKTISLAKGIYIVKVGDTAVKTLVNN